MPSSVYKIMSETKRKVAAGRSHGSCGSAPRNYGSCHGCSFVDGVFAPRGGCPNHEPRKLHPLPIPFPYFAYPSSHEAPRTTPFPPLRFPPSTFATNFPNPYSPYILADALHPDIVADLLMPLCGRLEMIYRKLENWRLSIVTPSSMETIRLVTLFSCTENFHPRHYSRFITRDVAYILNEHKI